MVSAHTKSMCTFSKPCCGKHIKCFCILSNILYGMGYVLRLRALSLGWLGPMNLVATHYNCTSPMDYISHHALHSHIPIHHYTNHTAVTIHSLALIVSPHLHLIHTHTFKQHSPMHSPRSLVLAPADISEHFPCILLPCVWPRTARPWNSEPVLVTSTPAWYCLRLWSASDIPVVVR